jgi:hypothetical protein
MNLQVRYRLDILERYKRLARITPAPSVTALAGTAHQDAAPGPPRYADPRGDWPDIIEEILGAPVALQSHGPTVAGKRARPWCQWNLQQLGSVA